jgi:hypothetical protein
MWAMVSVTAEKIGGEFFQPIGSTKGIATSFGRCLGVGNIIASRGVSCEAHTIKTVGQVNLEHVDWAPLGISEQKLAKKAFQGPSELHGFKRRQRKCVGILVMEAEIADNARATTVLRDYTKRGKTQVG